MQKKSTKATLVAGSLLAGMAFTVPTNADANNSFDFNELGNGSELRAEMLQLNNPFAFSEIDTDKYVELKCGESKCGEGDKKKDKKKADKKKAKEGKCGEGKCGKDAKKKKKKDKKKAKEGKCGGGSC